MINHPLWRDAEQALGEPLAGAISLDTTAAIGPLIRLLSNAAVLWLALAYGWGERGWRAVQVIALSGAAYAAYGLIIYCFYDNSLILWSTKVDYLDSLTSTFINRNSYAAYDGLTIICSTAVLARGLKRSSVIFLAAWIVQFAALLLTGSRGGVASTLLGLAVMLVVSLRSRAQATASAALVIAGIIVFLLAGNFVLDRMQSAELDRGQVFRLTTEIIAQQPWTGTGYGTFEDAFRMHRDESVVGTYDKAHDTYLEDGLELGLPATVLLYLALGTIVVACLRGLRRNRLLCGAGISASVLIGAHSIIDFSAQIPAVGLTYCVILGIAAAQSKAVSAASSR